MIEDSAQDAELADYLDELRDRVLELVAGYCGLRWGELAALRWIDVDPGNNVLRVAPRLLGRSAPWRDVTG